MREDFSLFILVCLTFLIFHAIPSVRGLRKKLTVLLGERAYLTIYSLISLALLIWVIYEATLAPKIYLWPFAMWTYWIPNILMPIAFTFLVAGATTANPLSIAAPRKGFDPDNPGMIVRVTRHPVLWAFALWSLAHLPPNGDVAVAAMFSVFAIFALLGLKLVDSQTPAQPRSAGVGATGEVDLGHPVCCIIAGAVSFQLELQ